MYIEALNKDIEIEKLINDKHLCPHCGHELKIISILIDSKEARQIICENCNPDGDDWDFIII